MGLTITSNYKGAIEITGGYSIMMTIREKVSLAFDKELGKHYQTLSRCFFQKDFDKFNEKANKIIRNERFKYEDRDILDFLFANDCRGSITHKTCKKIYDLIANDEKEVRLRYLAYSKNDWSDFKKLLKECYSHRAYMRWH